MNTGKCKSYGYKEHTKSFADCMKDVDFHNDEKDGREEDRIFFASDHTFFCTSLNTDDSLFLRVLIYIRILTA